MRARKPIRVQIMDIETVERMARIMGDMSAAHLALDDVKKHRAKGEDPVIVTTGTSLLVVPRADLVTSADMGGA